MKGFLVAGGSVPGADHTKPGQPGWTNNHDAFSWHADEDSLIGVVCDGCGSTLHPEVGAKIASRAVIKRLQPMLAAGMWRSQMNIPGALRMLQADLKRDIKSAALLMADEEFVQAAVLDHFFFTIVCVAMTQDLTALFSLGDGVISLNGETTAIRSAEGNAPPYIGQTLIPGLMPEKYLKFSILDIVPTAEVQSVLIGTDGVNDLASAADEMLPGKEIPVGPISQLWTDPKYVDNPDNIRRHLALVNLETIDESGERPRIKKGLLPDDTTLLVIRRMEGA